MCPSHERVHGRVKSNFVSSIFRDHYWILDRLIFYAFLIVIDHGLTNFDNKMHNIHVYTYMNLRFREQLTHVSLLIYKLKKKIEYRRSVYLFVCLLVSIIIALGNKEQERLAAWVSLFLFSLLELSSSSDWSTLTPDYTEINIRSILHVILKTKKNTETCFFPLHQLLDWSRKSISQGRDGQCWTVTSTQERQSILHHDVIEIPWFDMSNNW